MATRFEIVLQGEAEGRLRAAGEEALAEIAALEARLSIYQPASEIARINALAATRPVRVSPEVFRLIEASARLSSETEGAFDITVAPLLRCWGFLGEIGCEPSAEELAKARQTVGAQYLSLDPRHFTVAFQRAGMMLDLGAIGKGYAIDRAVETLRDAQVPGALIHGGTSTVYGLGGTEEGGPWKVAITPPAGPRPAAEGEKITKPFEIRTEGHSPSVPGAVLAVVPLRDEALSVSGILGKYFEGRDRVYGHVMDPRSGMPVRRACLAAVALPSATETDALSTALLALGPDGHERIARLREGIRTLVVSGDNSTPHARAQGIILADNG